MAGAGKITKEIQPAAEIGLNKRQSFNRSAGIMGYAAYHRIAAKNRKITMLPITERIFMQELRDTAMGMSIGNLNPDFVRAYAELADAADRIDAMLARLKLPPPGGWANDKPHNVPAA